MYIVNKMLNTCAHSQKGECKCLSSHPGTKWSVRVGLLPLRCLVFGQVQLRDELLLNLLEPHRLLILGRLRNVQRVFLQLDVIVCQVRCWRCVLLPPPQGHADQFLNYPGGEVVNVEDPLAQFVFSLSKKLVQNILRIGPKSRYQLGDLRIRIGIMQCPIFLVWTFVIRTYVQLKQMIVCQCWVSLLDKNFLLCLVSVIGLSLCQLYHKDIRHQDIR